MAAVAPDVRVFTDADSLSQAAAAIFVETAGEAVRDRGRCLISLSGGETPKRMYSILAQRPQRDLVTWGAMHFFWGDERCVPPEDLNSNYRTARELLLGHVPVPPENIHRVRTELEPELAAEDYALALSRSAEPPLQFPRFDLVLLGLGEDGHTASLFPHSNLDEAAVTMAVQVAATNARTWRVSLMPQVFNAARKIVFLVQGAGKSAIVANVLYGAHQPEAMPAQRIRPTNGELIWLLDSGAAAG